MEKEENKSKLQEKYVQIELLNKQLEQIEFQINSIMPKIEELMYLRNAIEKISPSEGFSQLGSGVFIKSKFEDSNTFLVNVGRKIFVKMNKKDAENYINKKINELKSVQPHMIGKAEQLQKEIQSHVLELQNLQGQV